MELSCMRSSPSVSLNIWWVRTAMKDKTEQKLKMYSVKQLASRSHRPYMYIQTMMMMMMMMILIITSKFLSLKCEKSCLIFIPRHSMSHNCFAVVNWFDYLSQFSNCNISGAHIIDSVKPATPPWKIWICPCNKKKH